MLCTPLPKEGRVETEASGGGGYIPLPTTALDTPERPNGYYWVVMEVLKWTIAEYKEGCWYLPGDDYWYRDHNLLAIDETPIVSPGKLSTH